MDEQSLTGQWRINALITTAVLLTVVLSLGLAQTDRSFLRSVSAPATMPVAVLLGTATPELVPLPTNTATLRPVLPTATSETTPVATAVAVQPICVSIPPGWVAYTVQPGDTLASLAARSGATVSELRQANCLENSLILAGMTIYLPAVPPERPVCGPPVHWVRYQVQAGDTKYGLARSRGTTIYAIDLANCFRPLLAGTFIFLPPLPATATPLPPTATPTQTNTAVPTVTATGTPGTPTAIATVTGTPVTVTPTITPTSTVLPTVSPTGTLLPTVTATSTGTPVPTATNTPGTPTPTATITPTPAHTATPTPLPTTPTATPPPATATPTAVPPSPTPD